MTGAELKRRRKLLNLTQSGMAKLLDIHEDTVGRWELAKQGIRHAKAIDARLREIEKGRK